MKEIKRECPMYVNLDNIPFHAIKFNKNAMPKVHKRTLIKDKNRGKHENFPSDDMVE